MKKNKKPASYLFVIWAIVSTIILTGSIHIRNIPHSFIFSDIHNSALAGAFSRGDSLPLLSDKNQVELSMLKNMHAGLIVFSLGVARFDMRHPDTVKIESVIKYMRFFDEYIREKAPDTRTILAMEGSHLIKGNLNWVDSLHDAGLRMWGIAHWFHNEFIVAYPGDTSSYRYQAPSRLTDSSVLSVKGIELIEKLNDLSIWIDVSHLPDKAFWQLVQLNNNRTPLMASHSNCRALCDVPRNLSDSQIEAIIASGGLIGVCLHTPLLCDENASLEQIAQQIVYLVNNFGDQHIALGTDIEGRIRLPADVEKYADIEKLIPILQRQGLPDSSIRKIYGKNAIRILVSQK